MIDSNAVTEAREKILDLVHRTVTEGEQTKNLPGEAVAAAGQYLYPHTGRQSGLHGAAAAIRVLGDSSMSHHREAARALIRHLANPPQYENDASRSNESRNRTNVLKQSELLYSLKFAPGDENVDDVRKLTDEVKERLLERFRQAKDGGWTYDTNDSPERASELLPTAFAIRALACHNIDVDRALAFVKYELEQAHSSEAEISVRVACLYHVWFSTERARDYLTERLAKELLQNFFRTLAPLMHEPLESNIEYTRRDHTHHYVRVPWQLYLVRLAADLDRRWFAHHHLQERLSELVEKVQTEGGFRYPHSGSRPSTRTYAIAYETLGDIRPNLITWPTGAYARFDKLRSSPMSRVLIVTGATSLMAVSVLLWIVQDDASLAESGPSLLAAVLFAALGLGRSR